MSASMESSRSHADNARAAKRAHAGAIGINERFVSSMVEEFYLAIREDNLLGPIFMERIADWAGHLDRMKVFWRSVLFNSGEFSGNPMQKHIAIPGLDEAHFARWLTIFYATLKRLDAAPEGNALVAARARSIADSLLTGISVRREGLAGSKAGKDLPHV